MPVIFSKEHLGKDRVDGFYETPRQTVMFMADLALKYCPHAKTVLDPCVGDGVFLDEFANRGFRGGNLFGLDIDEQKVASLKQRFANIHNHDATMPIDGRYDIIIGNPPYNGDESYFIRENRDRLKKEYAPIGAKNTFSMITYNAVRNLDDGGVIVKIVSDAFLTNKYYEKFRNFLLEEMEVLELILCPSTLFRHIKADVRTCILVARKKKPECVMFKISDNNIRMVDRIQREEDYKNPERVEFIKQADVSKFPTSSFIIGVPDGIKDIYLNSDNTIDSLFGGGTGISTGKDKLFLRKRSDIKNKDLESWVPYYKNGARSKYYYEPDFFIERDYQKHSDAHHNYMVRNKKFFFKEGITCSSVGVRFSASYMPPGGLFGVNANFFTDDKKIMYYTLAFLNSRLAWYFARRVLVRTNNISSNYLKRMPIVLGSNADVESIADETENIVKMKMRNLEYDSSNFEKRMDRKFFDIYELGAGDIKDVDDFCSDFYAKL